MKKLLDLAAVVVAAYLGVTRNIGLLHRNAVISNELDSDGAALSKAISNRTSGMQISYRPQSGRFGEGPQRGPVAA